MPSRPDRLVLVVGTGTEVGKTWVTCALAARLRADGWRVAARKPAQSHDPADGRPTDAELLADATGEAVDEVCPPGRTYEVPMAPPMAADVLGRPVPSLAELADGLDWPPGIQVGMVETAGGVRSPLAPDGDGADLARLLHPDVVVLVADAGLGTIHAVRSAVSAIRDWPFVAVLNRFDPGDELHRRNLAWLAERDGLPVHVRVADVARLLAPVPAPIQGGNP